MSIAEHVARMEEDRSAFKMLTSKPIGKRPRRRWEDNTRIDLKEIGVNARNGIDWTQDIDYWRHSEYDIESSDSKRHGAS